MRCLGFIKFYNQDKGFGFIATNKLGIATSDSNDTNQVIELYFKKKDLDYPWSKIPHQGDFVSFEYEPSARDKSQGCAKHIQEISFTDEDFSIAKLYLDSYSTIICGRDRFRVIPYFLNRAFVRDKQSAYNMLLEGSSLNATEISKIIIESSLHNSNLFSLFVNPENNGIVVTDAIHQKAIVTEVSLKLLTLVMAGSNSLYDTLFVVCVKQLDEDSLALVSDSLLELINNNVKLIDILLKKLDSSQLNQVISVFPIGEEKKRYLVVLYNSHYSRLSFNDDVIDFWNRSAIDSPESTFTRLALFNKIPNRQSLYSQLANSIAFSNRANDYLLLISSLVANNCTCFQNIKDYSICYSWFAKQDKILLFFLRNFIYVSSKCSISVLKQTLASITAPRVVQFIGCRQDVFECLPKEMFVDLKVSINTTIETEVKEETDWHGGYFTWGEGMKNEHYEIYTYLKKEYVAHYFIDKEHSYLSHGFPESAKSLFAEQVKSCIEQKNNNKLFGWSCNNDCIFVRLCLSDDSENASTAFLFSQEGEAKVLINTEVVYD